MIKLISLFLFFSTILSAQEGTWQNYTNIKHFSAGVDLGDHLLLANWSTLIALNKENKKPEMIDPSVLGLPEFIKDIAKGVDDNLFFLGADSQIVERKGETSTVWPADPLIEWNRLNTIFGQSQSGALYFQSGTGKLISYDGNEPAKFVTTLPEGIVGRLRGAIINSNDQKWVWSNTHLALLDADESLLFTQVFTGEYIYNIAYDDRGYLWVFTNENVHVLTVNSGEWSMISFEDIGIVYASRFLLYPDNSALIMAQNQVFDLVFDGTSFQVDDLSAKFTKATFPYSYSLLDDDGRLWYVHTISNKLVYWDKGATPEVITYRPWVPVHNINGLAIDKQGKTWLGGFYNLSYLLGGKWNLFEVIDPFSNFENGGINEIVFTDDNRPIVGVGNQAFFVPTPSFVLEWTGANWDTLRQATLGSSFLRISHLKLDAQQNLWVLRSGENIFSVRSRDKWIRFKITDVPLEPRFFTCLTNASDDKMWIGTDNGIITYNGFNFESIDAETLSLDNAIVTDIFFDDKEQIWVTTSNNGIRKWNGSNWEILQPDIEGIPITSYRLKRIIQGQGNEMWVSLTGEGLLHFDGQFWSFVNQHNSGLTNYSIERMLKDEQDRIWFTSGENKVSVLNPGNNQIIPFELQNSNYLAVYPNPGCCLYRLHWKTNVAADTRIELLNITGQLIRKWEYNMQEAGTYDLDIEQKGLLSGTYLVRLIANEQNIKTIPLVVTN